MIRERDASGRFVSPGVPMPTKRARVRPEPVFIEQEPVIHHPPGAREAA